MMTNHQCVYALAIVAMIVAVRAISWSEFFSYAGGSLAITVFAGGAHTTWTNVIPVVCKVSDIDATWMNLDTPVKCIGARFLLAVWSSLTIASSAMGAKAGWQWWSGSAK